MALTFEIEYVYNYFKENNCELLSTTYKNNITPLEYKCSCGNISTIRFNDFKRGTRCKLCGWNKTSKTNKNKYSQDEVNKIFEEAGCKCLDIYKNTHTKISYRCSCGNISKITFSIFLKGSRCKKCGYAKITGENSKVWITDRNKLKTIQELHSRSLPYKYQYKKKYNIDKSLHVDHIFPIKAFRDHNIFDLNLINSEDNFQVLTKSENSKKNAKYNKDEFLKYISKGGILCQS